ncbi:MFS transporter [Leifsonia sp. NPDC058248]|uniref:MFS transporter n=1 Tax=Leifsonia sp. NPDC058248 TaxID=3346402 RepID=UPI0036D899F6
MSNPAIAAEQSLLPDKAPRRERLTGPVRRLVGFIVPVYVGVYLVVGAVPNILLPLQVQGIDETHKAANLAIVTGVGAFVAMIASPIAGLISDRTRSRFGRRAPYLVFGSIATGLALVGMGFANGVAQLVIAWAIVQLTLNFVISPLTALMPDRVPTVIRGLFSSLLGLGTMIGVIAGQVAGASFAQNIQAGYFILPGIMLVVIALFVVFCPDQSTRDQVNEPFSLGVFLRTFWVSPRKHRDFFWGFLGRILLYTGYFAVTGYQLYVLQDYIGLGSKAAGVVALLGIVNLLGVIVTMSFSGPLSDRLGRRKVFVIVASVVMAVGMAIPLVSPTLIGMILFTLVSSFGFGAYMSVDGALMADLLPSANSYAKDLGVLNIAATLPQTVGPFLSGAIVVVAGYAALFPVGIALALLGALAILPIKSVR